MNLVRRLPTLLLLATLFGVASIGCSDGDTSPGSSGTGTSSSAATTSSSAATTGAGGDTTSSSTSATTSSSTGEGGSGGAGGEGTSVSGTGGEGTSSGAGGEGTGSGAGGEGGEGTGSGAGGAGGEGTSSGAGGAGGAGTSSSTSGAGTSSGTSGSGAGVGGAGGSGTGSSASSSSSSSSSSSTGAGGAGGSGGAGGGPVVITDPGTAGDGNYTIGPFYLPAPEGVVTPGVPVGTIYNFTLSSSVIFPGITGAYTRKVAVYVPQQYTPGVASPFIVVQDGIAYLDRVAPVLDNLIFQHRLPSMIAVFVNAGPGNGPGSERGLEYDTVSNDYVNFIETEILPKVQMDYGVKLTTDPEGRAAMGGSSGGAAAFTMGWLRPDLYRRIITYSGSFVKLHPDATYPDGAADFWMNLIPTAPPKPLRVFLEVGDMDLVSNMYGSWKLGNIHMATEMAAKGYHYRYLYATNAGHIDSAVIKSTLAETLLWVWRGYPIN